MLVTHVSLHEPDFQAEAVQATWDPGRVSVNLTDRGATVFLSVRQAEALVPTLEAAVAKAKEILAGVHHEQEIVDGAAA